MLESGLYLFDQLLPVLRVGKVAALSAFCQVVAAGNYCTAGIPFTPIESAVSLFSMNNLRIWE